LWIYQVSLGPKELLFFNEYARITTVLLLLVCISEFYPGALEMLMITVSLAKSQTADRADLVTVCA